MLKQLNMCGAIVILAFHLAKTKFGFVFKHLPRDPANVNTLKTTVGPYNRTEHAGKKLMVSQYYLI